jgi:hypothetical protein
MRRIHALILVALVATQASGGGIIMGPVVAAGGTPPDVGATNTGVNNSSNATTGTVNLPASISAGNILFAVLGFNQATPTSITVGNIAAPDEYAETRNAAASSVSVRAFKVADGAEGASAASAWTNSSRHSAIAYKVTGTSDTAITCGTVVTGTGTGPDPPSASFTAPALIITYINVDDNAVTVDADPTGFATSCIGSTVTGNRTRMCACRATVGTDCSSGDPTAWTLSASAEYITQTCAIEDN